MPINASSSAFVRGLQFFVCPDSRNLRPARLTDLLFVSCAYKLVWSTIFCTLSALNSDLKYYWNISRRPARLVDADLGSELSYHIIIPQLIELFVSTVVLLSI